MLHLDMQNSDQKIIDTLYLEMENRLYQFISVVEMDCQVEINNLRV